MWSPTWEFDDATFERSAAAFDNPDFVDVVVHSYRVRYGLVPGDPAYANIETRLTALPAITVPTIHIDGADNGVRPAGGAQTTRFTGPYEHRIWQDAGHNLPQEKPGDWVRAVLDVRRMAGEG